MKTYTNKLLNLSVETMIWIVENIIVLLQGQSNLLSLYRSVFVISSSCFFKVLSSIFLKLIKRDCLSDWKRGSGGENELQLLFLDRNHILG